MTKVFRVCAAMALAIILTAVLYSVVTAKASTKKEMRYLDRLATKIQLDDPDSDYEEATPEESGMANIHGADESYIEILERVKQDIRRNLSDYDGLDWKRFESVSLLECDMKTERYAAIYKGKPNSIYLSSNYPPRNLTDFKKKLCHELIHALLWVDRPNPYNEGLTEYLAQRIYPESKDTQYYKYNVIIAKILVDGLGVQGMIDLTNCGYDTFYEKISEYIGAPESAKKLSDALRVPSVEHDSETDVLSQLACVEAACRLTANFGLDKNEAKLLYGGGSVSSADPEIAEAQRYFNSILDA